MIEVPTEEEISSTKFASANNLVVERIFGDLSSSLHRRPNATYFHHTTVHHLKKHRGGIRNWLKSLTKKDHSRVWKEAATKAPVRRREHLTKVRTELVKSIQQTVVLKRQRVGTILKSARAAKRQPRLLEEQLQKVKSSTNYQTKCGSL